MSERNVHRKSLSSQKNVDADEDHEIVFIPYTFYEAIRKSVILPPLPEPPPIIPCRCAELWKPKKRKKKKKRVIPADVLERRTLKQYLKKYPLKIYVSNPCPNFPQKLDKFLNEEFGLERLLQIEENNCLYLKHALLAKSMGAWDAVKASSAFYSCKTKCACISGLYSPHDHERTTQKMNDDFYKFKQQVKHTYREMYVMYLQLEDPWPIERYYEMYPKNTK